MAIKNQVQNCVYVLDGSEVENFKFRMELFIKVNRLKISEITTRDSHENIAIVVTGSKQAVCRVRDWCDGHWSACDWNLIRKGM
jgi:hypothetical protein